MERRFNGVVILTIFFGVLFLNNVARAEAVQDKKAPAVNENTGASLEMIAELMKALSGSLPAIPEPPRLNQVIHLPEGYVPPAENIKKTNTDKETQR